MAGKGYDEMKGKGKGYDDAMGHDEIKGKGYEEKSKGYATKRKRKLYADEGQGQDLADWPPPEEPPRGHQREHEAFLELERQIGDDPT